jgi:hypothetical protein
MTMTPGYAGPNPDRIGACPGCGSYRTDGHPPYLHHPGCARGGDLQIDRFLGELAAGTLAGPPILTPEDEAVVDEALRRLRAAP